MKKLLSILVLYLCFSGSASAQTIDFAIRISEPGSISSLMGAEIKIEILDTGSMSSLLGNTEKWQVVGACSNTPNLTVEILESGSISSLLGDTKKIEIVENSIFGADKKICITNANDLDNDTLRILKLID
jgi:hypothetical protein